VAPGTWIVSTRAVDSYFDTNYHDLTLLIGDYKNDRKHSSEEGDYFTLTGTSMAAPMVSGTVALMLQREPWITPATVKARLMKSTVKDELLVFETGAGYLDVEAALNATGNAQSALSPTVMLADDDMVYMEDIEVIWGDDWTNGAIWRFKGRAKSIEMTDVPDSITQTYGAIWRFKVGRKSIVDNYDVTGSGVIWSAEPASIQSTTDTVDLLGAIWRSRRK